MPRKKSCQFVHCRSIFHRSSNFAERFSQILDFLKFWTFDFDKLHRPVAISNKLQIFKIVKFDLLRNENKRDINHSSRAKATISIQKLPLKIFYYEYTRSWERTCCGEYFARICGKTLFASRICQRIINMSAYWKV